jgi:hypothetical protein
MIAQIAGQAEREISRDQDFAQSLLAQEKADDGGHAGPFDAEPPQLFQALAVGDDAAMGDLLFDAVQFQIIDHGMTFAVHAEENERVGREQAHGVKHIRIALAVCHDQ